MRTAAIIAEFDPFHKGHLHLIREARKTYHADRVIVIMSGSFVQRGGPASLPPALRTKMALMSGADLVLQLPVYGSLGSAEIFAESAVFILNSLGIPDVLCFGCEDDDLPLMMSIAHMLTHESDDFKSKLNENLRTGMTYPAARSKALAETTGNAHVKDILGKPNNILAVEYLKALISAGSRMQPCPVRRIGKGHGENVLAPDGPVSASAIRRLLPSLPAEEIRQLPYLPEASKILISDHMSHAGLLDIHDFSEMALFAMTVNEKDLSDFCHISEDMAGRFESLLPSFTDIDHLIKTMHTKNMTESRIRRSVCSVLLNHRKEIFDNWRQVKYAGYVNVLGMRKESSGMLSLIPDTVRRTMILRPRDLDHLKSPGQSIAAADLYADTLYRRMSMIRFGECSPELFWKTIIM